MKYLVPIVLVMLFSGLRSAEAKPLVYKSWKTFKSDNGYEFRYPSCWKVEIDNGEYEGPLKAAKEIFVSATDPCKQPRLSKDVPNGVGFSTGWGPKKTKAAALKEIEIMELNAPNNIKRNKYKAFKRFKLGSVDAVAWVRVNVGYIRWQLEVYCPDRWVRATGPFIDDKNISKSLLEKFKKGDIGWPEPEGTIIRSIRCIPPHRKAKEKTKGT